jgi:hypothetical protein
MRSRSAATSFSWLVLLILLATPAGAWAQNTSGMFLTPVHPDWSRLPPLNFHPDKQEEASLL